MENITVGQIATGLAVIGGLITGFALLKTWFEKCLNNMLKEQFNDMGKRIEALDKRMTAIDLESCKNYLVSFLSCVEAGQHVSETALERFHEQYHQYTNVHCENGYIKSKVEKLQRDGKL